MQSPPNLLSKRTARATRRNVRASATTFFAQLKSVINDRSIITVQSTSPLVARKSYWCVNNTLEAVGFKTAAFHAYVPSFGEWGFVMASLSPYTVPDHYIGGLKFLNPETAQLMFSFPPDMAKVQTKIQRLDDQALVRYFDQEWGEYLVY